MWWHFDCQNWGRVLPASNGEDAKCHTKCTLAKEHWSQMWGVWRLRPGSKLVKEDLPPVRVESLDSKLGGEEMGWGRDLQNKVSTAWLRCCNKYRIPVPQKREADSLSTWSTRGRSRWAGGSNPKALWGPGCFASLLRASLGCWLGLCDGGWPPTTDQGTKSRKEEVEVAEV